MAHDDDVAALAEGFDEIGTVEVLGSGGERDDGEDREESEGGGRAGVVRHAL